MSSRDRRIAAAAQGPRTQADTLDRRLRAAVGAFTGGVSPAGMAEAWLDWACRLAVSPGRLMYLGRAAVADGIGAVWSHPIETHKDPRFRDPSWRAWPFCAYASGFQACERWWSEATSGLSGVRQRDQRLTAFMARQLLDVVSPSNFVGTNPQVLARAAATGGHSLVEGALTAVSDLLGQIGGPVDRQFVVGRDVAATPGEVVLRTRLAEVIQYKPSTPTVHPEPVVIVPAWIMKYYILDLSPAESLVHALVAEGFTVFMVSWRNPSGKDRDLGFDDYSQLGAKAAIDAARAITRQERVHAVGYCVGGTLLAMTAAAMARDGQDHIATLTLLAAQTDFTEAGELSVFTNEAQVALLEDLMAQRGYLAPEQMAGTFQILKDNDLIWSKLVHDYLMGAARTIHSLDEWSADGTRLPCRMESQNLRQLYLENDLAEGRFEVGGRPVALRDIRAPIFLLGTETDHIAPWRSVYKAHLLCSAEITFVLADHGHNLGVVASPAIPLPRHWRMREQPSCGAYEDPESWFHAADVHEGSWWPEWFEWLHVHSRQPGPPPPIGASKMGYAPLGPAPGAYVLES